MWHKTLGSTFSNEDNGRHHNISEPSLKLFGAPPPSWRGQPTTLKPFFWESTPKRCVWKPIFSAGRRRRWNNRRHSEVHLKKSMETGRGVDRLSNALNCILQQQGKSPFSSCRRPTKYMRPPLWKQRTDWRSQSQKGGACTEWQQGRTAGWRHSSSTTNKEGENKEMHSEHILQWGWVGGAVETQQFQRYPCSVMPSKLESQRSVVKWNETTVCCVHFLLNDAL